MQLDSIQSHLGIFDFVPIEMTRLIIDLRIHLALAVRQLSQVIHDAYISAV
jgi:hypothetical protein